MQSDLHLSKAVFSLDPDNLQLHCFLGLGALFCCSFFCPLDQTCRTLQTVQVTDPNVSQSLTAFACILMKLQTFLIGPCETGWG